MLKNMNKKWLKIDSNFGPKIVLKKTEKTPNILV